jgi:LmbE family N-acetylglucosaminyl deacetylase
MATVVSFHAHPDDEALLTGGTLAMLSARGHRVVIVVACDGIMGPAGSAFWALDRLPLPLFRLLLGREWFTEPRSAPGTRRTNIL